MKYKPGLSACELQVSLLGEKLEGKDMVIIGQEEMIANLQDDISKLEKTNRTLGIVLGVSVPSAIIIGGIIGAVIRGKIEKK